MKQILIIIGLLALLPIMMLCEGFTLYTLWNWFAVPIGWPTLSIPVIMGLGIIFRTFNYKQGDKPLKQNKEEAFQNIGLYFVRLLFTLLIGWILTLFI